MNLQDATLMFLTESGASPGVAKLAQSAYDQLDEGGAVDYRVLQELIGEASGKGVLRALHRKCSPVACEAILMPILSEIGRQAPVPPRRRAAGYTPGPDPLTDPSFGR